MATNSSANRTNADKDEKLRRLKELEATPPAQTTYAIELLDMRNGRAANQAALRVLARRPSFEARPALTRLFEQMAANNGSRDPGTYTRSLIVHALRPIASHHDAPLLVTAVRTYEWPPPAFKEEAGLLRGGALVVLNELDDQLARYFAAELLGSGHTDPMSGEPARTAVMVLASQDEFLPLVAYASRPPEQSVPEVVAECLRRLVTVPEIVVEGLMKHIVAAPHPAAQVGLFELLINHRTGPHGIALMQETLRDTSNLDLYRYVTTAMVAHGHAALRQALIESARLERNSTKLGLLFEAAELAPGDHDLEEMAARIDEQLRRKRTR